MNILVCVSWHTCAQFSKMVVPVYLLPLRICYSPTAPCSHIVIASVFNTDSWWMCRGVSLQFYLAFPCQLMKVRTLMHISQLAIVFKAVPISISVHFSLGCLIYFSYCSVDLIFIYFRSNSLSIICVIGVFCLTCLFTFLMLQFDGKFCFTVVNFIILFLYGWCFSCQFENSLHSPEDIKVFSCAVFYIFHI